MTQPAKVLPTLFGLKEAHVDQTNRRTGKKTGEKTGWTVYSLVDDWPVAVVGDQANAEWLIERLNRTVYHDRAMHTPWMRFVRAWLKFATSLNSIREGLGKNDQGLAATLANEDTWKKKIFTTKTPPSSALTATETKSQPVTDADAANSSTMPNTTPAKAVDSATNGKTAP